MSVSLCLCVCVVRRSEDANRSFSAAVQLHDSLVKAWALWGDYLDQLFTSDRFIIIILLYKCIFDQWMRVQFSVNFKLHSEISCEKKDYFRITQSLSEGKIVQLRQKVCFALCLQSGIFFCFSVAIDCLRLHMLHYFPIILFSYISEVQNAEL